MSHSARAVRFAGCALIVWLSACATLGTLEPGPSVPPERTATLHPSTPDPEVTALVTEFYGPTFDPDALGNRIDAALARLPDNGDLHELAFALALLRGDDDASEAHSLLAALDPGSASPALFLRRADEHHSFSLSVARTLAVQSPDAEVRAAARFVIMWADILRDDVGDARAQMEALGILSQWRVVGSFDNDQGKGFAARYPPEESIDLNAELPGLLVPVRWRKVASLTRYGQIPFDGMMWPNRQAVAYAVTFLSVPQEQDAVLWISTNSPVRVFVDGQVTISEENRFSGHPDSLATRLHLSAGPHTLLIKSANKSSHWNVTARLTSPNGELLPGLEQSADSGPGSDPNVRTPLKYEVLSPTRGLRAGLEKGRALLLGCREHMRAGDPQKAVVEATAFHAMAPDNPLAVYFLARASDDNGEQGKAIDMYDAGVRRFGGKLPRFYLERGRAYLSKGLYDKAQADAESFLRVRPKDLECELFLAAVLGKRGFEPERCRMLGRAVREHPDHADALRQLAACRVAEGKRNDAHALLTLARAISPGDDDTLYELFDLARHTMDNEAVRALTAERLRRVSAFPALFIDAGKAAEVAHDAAAAREAYEAAHELSPDWAPPLEHLAELAFAAGDDDGAERLWTEASVRDPANATLTQRLDRLKPVQFGALAKYVATESDIDAAVHAGETLKPADGSQIAVLLDEEATEVNADGSATRVVTEVRRALNEQGRDAMIAVSLPPHGRFRLLKAYARSPKGELQEPSSLREKAMRFRALEVGSTVVVQYVHYSPATHFISNEYIAERYFQSVAAEHRHSIWSLLLPKSRTLRMEVSPGIAHTTGEDSGLALHRFEATDVPPYVNEPREPPLRDILRRVSVSTVKDWDGYVRWERALLSDAFQKSEDLHALVARLTEGATTGRDKLDRLAAYVADKIRYQQDYENTIADVRPHSCRQVLERTYGDCKDKAVLLIALAREAGLRAEFAILRTRGAGRLDREVPNQQFNHAIVYVPAQEGIDAPYFVDATPDALDRGNLPISDQGVSAIVLDPGGKDDYRFEEISWRPLGEESSSHDVTLTVSAEDHVKAHDRASLRGDTAAAVRRVLRNAAYTKKMNEQVVSAFFPASTLTAASASDPADLAHPVWLDLDVDATNMLDIRGTGRRLRLPTPWSLEAFVALTERRAPLDLASPQLEAMHVTIDLPPGARVTEAPADFEVAATCASIKRRTSTQGTRVDMMVEFKRTCAEVTPEQYPEFRARILRAAAQLKADVAFETAPSVLPGAVSGVQ